MQWLGLKNIQDLDMLITDLPELEDTDFYRLMKEKWLSKGVVEGMSKTLVRIGRQFWGAEPADLPTILSTLTEDQLDALTDQMPKLSSWDDLRKLIPAKPESK